MKEYIEIFCSNDEEEIVKVKSAFERHCIEYNVSINNTDNVIFGISPLSSTRDLSYKYQIQIIENDIDTAENIIKELLLISNEKGNEVSEVNTVYESDKDKNADNNEKTNISKSILVLFVFCHFSRFYEFVSMNIKNKKTKIFLFAFSVFFILCSVFLLSINFVQWFGPVVGMLGSIFIIVVFQFFINLIDYIITRNTVQGYTWLILLGLIILTIIGVRIFPRSS